MHRSNHRRALGACFIGVALTQASVALGGAIMTYDEYQTLRHEEPYVVRLNTGGGALLHFGSRHVFDPADSQFATHDDEWDAFHPDVLLTEGHDADAEGLSRNRLIQKYGEIGAAVWLAARDSVPVHSLEPDRVAEIEYLRKSGRWTAEEIKTFYLLRRVTQAVTSGADIDFDDAVTRYMAFLENERGLTGTPDTVAQLNGATRGLLGIDSFTEVPQRFFYPGPQRDSHFTNDISTATNIFRDEHHVRVICDAVEAGHRVFVVVGSAHAVMQEPAIRSTLNAPD